MVRLRILPPKHLFHPVLGQFVKDKLLFHLCSKCAAEARAEFCTHSDEERSFTDTFFTGEVQLAVSKGYVIMQT